MATELGTRLTEADHEHFLEHGFVLLRGVVPPDIVAAALKVLGADEAEAHSISDTAKEEAAKQCATVGLMAAVNELLGPDYAVRGDEGAPSHLPRPPTPDAEWSLEAHMDLIHPTLVPDFWAVGAFVYLTEVRHHGGAFTYAPGSPHRMRSLMSRFSGETGWGATRAEGAALVEFLGEPGDAIVFQHPMVHSASPNIEGRATRHALRFSFPVARLVVGRKPVAALSSVEKANSPRYLRSRYGDQFCAIDVGDADRELAEGFGPVATHDVLKFDSRLHRYWTTPAEPSVVRRAVSTDLASWELLDPLTLVDEPVTALHLEHRYDPSLTLLGSGRTGGTWTRVFTSSDLESWQPMLHVPGTVLSRPHLIGPFMAKKGRGNVTYFMTDDVPNEIRWRSGGDRSDFDNWTEGGVAHAARAAVTDVWSRPGPAMYLHVLVAEIESVPHYTMGPFQDDFRDEMVPFEFAAGPARQLRCHERAQGYWLVSFVRDDRLFWGEVDWAAAPGRVTELTSAAELQRALEIVGAA